MQNQDLALRLKPATIDCLPKYNVTLTTFITFYRCALFAHQLPFEQRQDLQPMLLIHHQSFSSPGILFINQNFSIANRQSPNTRQLRQRTISNNRA